MKQDFKVYFRTIRIHLLSALEYKGWWLNAVSVFLFVVTDPISTVLLFSRFGSIGPWTMERIILIYAMAVASFGLAETFGRGFDYFPWRMIRTGDFDRVLLRPRSVFTQVASSFFHVHRAVRAVTGLIVIFWSLSRQGVALTLPRALLLVSALAGGFLMYMGVFVMSSGIAFFTIKALDWIYILTNASYQVTRCPVDYMPRLLYGAFTFLMPLLVVSYYPASVLCGWGEPAWKGLLALPAGICFLVFSMGIWQIGMRRYQGTGS